MTEYQGHRSWNAWNVSMWIGNDEGLYHLAMECKRTKWGRAGRTSLTRAAAKFIHFVGEGAKTPDGAVFNERCVKEALAGLE
jgi:hypothetical protein